MSTVALSAPRPAAPPQLSRPSIIVAVTLAWSAAAIHLVLTPEHFEERTAYGVFFLAAVLFQGWLGWALLARPGPIVYRAGAYGSLGLIVTWIVTRAIAPPLTETGGPEPVTLLGVLATGAELATLFVLASVLPAAGRRRTHSRWAWGTAAGLAFILLFLLASSAVSYVPWVAKDLPAFNNQVRSFSLWSPFIIGMPVPHVWVVGPWSTFALTAIAGVLVGANVVVAMRHPEASPSCAPRRRGVFALAPTLFAVSSCCGSSVALFMGVSTAVALGRFTPWILIATVTLLAANLAMTRRNMRTVGRSSPTR